MVVFGGATAELSRGCRNMGTAEPAKLCCAGNSANVPPACGSRLAMDFASKADSTACWRRRIAILTQLNDTTAARAVTENKPDCEVARSGDSDTGATC